MKRLARWILPALLAAVLLLQLVRALDLLRAQRLVWAVDARTATMIKNGALSPSHLHAHLKALTDARALDPAEVTIQVAIGSQSMLLGKYEEALTQYRDALELERRPEIYLNMGKCRQAQERMGDARRLYAMAVRLDPTLMQEVPVEIRAGVSKTLRRQDDANRAQQDGEVEP